MDDKTEMALQILRDVNDTLIIGLEGAVFYMENWEGLTPEKRQSIIDKVKGLIPQSCLEE